MKLRGKSLLVVFVVAFFVNSAPVLANWPDWRGPTCDGHSDVTGLPMKWSETENIVWKIPIHDLGYSTPVVWGDQIWLTTATKNGKTLYAVCIDFNSGRIVHDVEVFHPEKPQRIHPLNSYATPSAVVEEGFVYVHYGTHGTACLDTQTGKVLWRRSDLNCEHMQGPVSSPILFEDLLIVHLEGTDVQFIAALDKKTGSTVWCYDRPRELYENVEPVYLLKSYHTPVIVEVNGKPQLVSNGASLLYADNRIYMTNKEGKTTIIEPGREFLKLTVNKLDGFFGASPAVAGKSLLLRSKTHLHRVQNKQPAR